MILDREEEAKRIMMGGAGGIGNGGGGSGADRDYYSGTNRRQPSITETRYA